MKSISTMILGLSLLFVVAAVGACDSSDVSSATTNPTDTKATSVTLDAGVNSNLSDVQNDGDGHGNVGFIDVDGGVSGVRAASCKTQSDCTKMIGCTECVCLFGFCHPDPAYCDLAGCKTATYSCAFDLTAVCDGCSRKSGCIRTAACVAFKVTCCGLGTAPADAISTPDSNSSQDVDGSVGASGDAGFGSDGSSELAEVGFSGGG